MSSHNTTAPYVYRPTWQFFRKTKVEVTRKPEVASSLLPSKELFGAGCMPPLTTVERQRLHSNVLSVYRKATCSDHRGEEGVHTFSDSDLLHVFELCSPFTYVRFARLRLAIRMAVRTPIELVALVFEARSDTRAWWKALAPDLVWLHRCDTNANFTIRSWFTFARAELGKARALARKIATAKVQGRSL